MVVFLILGPGGCKQAGLACKCPALRRIIPFANIRVNGLRRKKAVDRFGLLRIVRRCPTDTRRFCAPLAELVDALDSKSSSERSAGSIPAWGTKRSSGDQ